MSDTEIGIIPKPHEWHLTDQGLTRWRPILDSITVLPLSAGRRLLRVSNDGGEPVQIVLDREQAAHLAGLLT